MAIEVGKNRLEALGDVEETADLIRYYCDAVAANDGFDHPMGNLGDTTVHTRSVLKPHGVWAVISPFNFPMALSGGPAGGALVAGNAVVYKPSSDAPLCGVKLAEIADACRPAARRLQHGHRAGRDRGVRAARERGGRRPPVHRLVRDRLQRDLQDLQQAIPQAGRGRDGRQEPCDRQRAGGPRGGGRGRHALGVRLRRPEVLRLQPRLRRSSGVRGLRRAARRQDEGHHRRRSHRPQGTGWGRWSMPGPWPSTRRRSPKRSATAASSSAGSGSRPATRRDLLRSPDDRRRPARRSPHLARRALRAARRRRPVQVARRGASSAPTTRSTA